MRSYNFQKIDQKVVLGHGLQKIDLEITFRDDEGLGPHILVTGYQSGDLSKMLRALSRLGGSVVTIYPDHQSSTMKRATVAWSRPVDNAAFISELVKQDVLMDGETMQMAADLGLKPGGPAPQQLG